MKLWSSPLSKLDLNGKLEMVSVGVDTSRARKYTNDLPRIEGIQATLVATLPRYMSLNTQPALKVRTI